MPEPEEPKRWGSAAEMLESEGLKLGKRGTGEPRLEPGGWLGPVRKSVGLSLNFNFSCKTWNRKTGTRRAWRTQEDPEHPGGAVLGGPKGPGVLCSGLDSSSVFDWAGLSRVSAKVSSLLRPNMFKRLRAIWPELRTHHHPPPLSL